VLHKHIVIIVQILGFFNLKIRYSMCYSSNSPNKYTYIFKNYDNLFGKFTETKMNYLKN